MPYITEEIRQTLPHDGEALIVAKWPEYDEALSFLRSKEPRKCYGAHPCHPHPPQ